MQKSLVSKYWFGIVGILVIASRICYGSSDCEILSEKSILYEEIMSVAMTWKDAVLKKDIEVMVSYALPEAQKYVKDNLQNKRSNLYRFFYDSRWNQQRGRRSVYDILKSATHLKIVIVQHKTLEKRGSGVSIYYYDEDKIKPKFPLSSKEIQLLIDTGYIVSMFFFKTEGRWYTSYEFE